MKRSTNEKTAIILAVSVILSVTACSAEGVAYVDGNRSEPGFSSSAAATSGTIYEESTLPATVSITTAVTTTKAKETTAVLTTVASTPATTAKPKWKETKKSAEMYLNTSVYSRTKAYLGAPTADLYMINDKVKVVAVTDTDYYKLENGRFIHCDDLSSEQTVIRTTTATTPPPEMTVPAAVTTANKQTPIKKGKYISSGYEPLDEKIQPILDKIITKDMSDKQKLKAVYDYLMQSSYIERTLLIPQSKKQYTEQLYACFIIDNKYGV